MIFPFRKCIMAGLFFCLHGLLFAQTPLLTNTDHRNVFTLNGIWKYVVDPYESGYYDYRRAPRDQQENPSKSESLFLNYHSDDPSERIEYDFEKSDNILVPRDWNSQKEKLFYYEGTVWYYKSFDYPEANRGGRQFLYFGAVNYEAHVYLNGKKLGQHVGGFTPFNFEITGQVKEKDNFLIVKVDNTRSLEKVPTVNTDWWNYGGITRDVKIITTQQTFIQDYYVQLAKADATKMDLRVVLNGSNKANQKVVLDIPEANIKTTLVTDASGQASTTLAVSNLKLWSPESPYLYDVNWTYEGAQLSDRIGFRTLQTKGADILLNGKSIFLRGICIHEENPIRGGRAYSKEDAKMLLGWAKELGCNFVRLAHYTHNEHMIRTAEELGILVWSEVPVYWTIQWENEATFENAKNQLASAITRDKNRAPIIIWSMANETPVSPPRTEFLKKMIDITHAMDPVRFVSAAMERHTKEGSQGVQVIGDPLQSFVDIISFNQYIGWYDGLPDKTKSVTFDFEFEKPVIISEFGAGALQGLHGEKNQRWTEEYQEDLYDQTLVMLDKIPQLRGITPWILADFRSPRRLLPDIQDGWNRKGLISETGNKKKAFFILQKYYGLKQKQYAP